MTGGPNPCPECGRYDNPAPCVQGWLERDGRYLVLQRAREPHQGKWDMPGGFVEPGEHPEEAVRRELREETGLEIEVLGLIGVFPSVYGDTGRTTLDLAYSCRVTQGDFALSEESTNSKWLALEDFPELAFPAERAALQTVRDAGSAS